MRGIIIALLLTSQVVFTQSSLITDVITKIEFRQDTVKDVFLWITDNVTYDIRKLNNIKANLRANQLASYKSEEHYKNQLLERVIKQRRGVCEDYSLLFDEIMKQLGYESFIIEGFIKNPNGKIERRIGHTWNAVRVNSEWRLYDATWGAGLVKDGKRFVKKYNKEWYDIDPHEMIKTHMPFDPLWQLFERPISYQEFELNETINVASKTSLDPTIVDAFVRKEKSLQLEEMISRSTRLGSGIKLIRDWKELLRKHINLYGMLSQEDLMDEAFERSNEAVELYNEYVTGMNRILQGHKGNHAEAHQNLLRSKEEITEVIKIYDSIEVQDKKANNFINKSLRQARSLLKTINQELKKQ